MLHPCQFIVHNGTEAMGFHIAPETRINTSSVSIRHVFVGASGQGR